jgi:hypothetical protein
MSAMLENASLCTYLVKIIKCSIAKSGKMSLSHNGSLGNANIKKGVKVEGAMSLYVQPLYGKMLKIIFDRKSPITHK